MKFIIKPLKDYMKRGRCYFKKLKTVIMHHYTLKIMNHNESDIWYFYTCISFHNDWLIFNLGVKTNIWQGQTSAGENITQSHNMNTLLWKEDKSSFSHQKSTVKHIKGKSPFLNTLKGNIFLP